MSFDISENLTFLLLVTVLVGSCATCSVADSCTTLELRKACIYKTGNPECKP